MKSPLLALALLIGVGRGTPGWSQDWPQGRGDGGFTGSTPVVLPVGLRTSWAVSGLAGADSPIVAGGRVYLIQPPAGTIVALDAATGNASWVATTSGLTTRRPAVTGGILVVASANDLEAVQGFDAASGERLWVQPYVDPSNCPGGVCPPCTSNCDGYNAPHQALNEISVPLGGQVIIYSSSDSTMMLRSAVNGDCITSQGRHNNACFPPPDSRPVTRGGVFYLSFCSRGCGACLEAPSFAFTEGFSTDQAAVAAATPDVYNDFSWCGSTLYHFWMITSFTASAYGITYQDGGPIAATADHLIFLRGDGAGLTAIHRLVGSVAWRSVALGALTRNSVAAGNGRIISVSGGRLVTLEESSGETLLDAVLPFTPTTEPVLAANAVVLGDGEGAVHVLDSLTLAEIGSASAGAAAVVGEVAVTESGLFATLADGTVACLRPGDGCNVRSTGYAQNGHQPLGPGGVNTLSGNVVFSVQDLSLPFAGLSINLLRTYNSQNATPQGRFTASGTVVGPGSGTGGTPFVSALGPGWTHSYDVALRPQYNRATGVTLFAEARGDGREPAFTQSATGTSEPPGLHDAFSRLTMPFALSPTTTGQGVRLTKKNGLARDFDPEGNLLRIRDPNGNRLELSYTPAGAFKPGAAGARLVALVWVSSTVSADGVPQAPAASATVTLAYDDEARLSLVRSPHPSGTGGVETSYAYDFSGRLTDVTVAGSSYHARYAYDGGNRLIEKQEPRAPPGEKHLRYAYDASGRAVAVRTASFADIASYWYASPPGGAHETQVIESAAGGPAITTYVYDRCSVLSQVRDALGGITAYRWDDALNQVELRDANGRSTTWFYDAKGNAVRVVDALGGSASYFYESHFNQIERLVDARGDETLHAYDAAGNLARTIRKLKPILTDGATAYVTRHDYDPRGLRISTTTAGGAETYFGYDDAGSLTATDRVLRLSPASATLVTTRSFYDALGRRIAEEDSNGVRTEFEYDLEHRLTKVRSGIVAGGTPLGESVREYDAMNRLTKDTDAAGRFTAFTYTERDQVLTVGDAMGHTTTHAYDPRGNRTKTVDPNGNATEFSYDLLGRLVGVQDAENGAASYGYDAVGNLTSVTDPNQRTTTYEYDALNRLARIVHPDGTQEAFTYDAVGNPLTRIDGRGVVTTLDYDSLGRVRRVRYFPGSTPAVTLTYDPDGNRLGAETTVDGEAYLSAGVFDSLNRLSYETISVDGQPFAKRTLTYDKAGNRLALDVNATATFGSDLAVAYAYDPLNRVTGVTHRGAETTYEYETGCGGGCGGGDLLVRIGRPNRTETRLTYDLAGRLTKLRNARQPSNSALSFFEYTYDQMGNRKTMRSLLGNHAFQYDKLYRLTGVDHPRRPDETYTYDSAGNRLSFARDGSPAVTYAHNEMNELESVTQGLSATAYTWDNAGNVATQGAAAYTFDGANRLTRVVLPSGTVIEYGYDPDGRRVKQLVNGQEEWFVFDGLSVVAEMGQDKKPTSVIVPGVSRTRMDWTKPFTEWFLTDGLGSVVQRTDERGNLTSESWYEPFGAPKDGVQDRFNRYRFVGLAHEDLTGLTYMNARWYDPGIGRFLSRDPRPGIPEHPQTQHPYAYAGNNPLNVTDVTGEGWWSDLVETAKDVYTYLTGNDGSDNKAAPSPNQPAQSPPDSTNTAAPPPADYQPQGQAPSSPATGTHPGLRTPTGSGESKLKAAEQLAEKARRQSDASGLPGRHNGPRDAYRHCIWSCMMTEELGNPTSWVVGTGHEVQELPWQPIRETKMDMHNNRVGRQLGATRKDSRSCADKCLGALGSGDLATIGGQDQ